MITSLQLALMKLNVYINHSIDLLKLVSLQTIFPESFYSYIEKHLFHYKPRETLVSISCHQLQICLAKG